MRRHEYRLDTTRYAEPGHIFGNISFLALCGDHLQLPPAPKNSGLLAPQDGASDEHKVGASMFARMEYVFEMHTMKRSTDSMLVGVLKNMRQPGGVSLEQAEWKALEAIHLDTEQLQQRPE